MTRRFRSAFFVSTCILLIHAFSPAYAQERGVKTSSGTPLNTIQSTPYSWTGFYVGLSVGLNGGNYQYKPVEVEAISAGEPEEPTQNRILNSASGGVFGIQGGYLYQLPSNIVVGAEADWNWTDYRSSMVLNEISGQGEAESELAKLRMGGFGTLRARLGYAYGSILPYVTGGVAVGRTSYLFAEGAEEAGQPPISKRGRTTWGYTLGAGFEYAINPALRLKTEYLYTSFGSFQAVGLENVNFKLASNFNMVRVGLNYSFGSNESIRASVPTSYSVQPRFDGFSLGLLAGLAAGSSNSRTVRTEETETSSETASFQLAGGLIGAEIGYQYKFSNDFVLGAFADYQFTNYQNQSIEAEINTEESAKEKKHYSIPQFGTVRLKAGYAFGSFLPYVTGGLAYGRMEFRQTELPIEEGTTPGRINQNKAGYTLGVGAEYAITSQLFIKSEYLYVNLGRIKGAVGAEENTNASLPINIGRIGLSYRF
jgi:outer membrane immunogenic protein